jgi:hypothetical protein
MFYNTDVLDSLSLHGFSLSNHQDGPLYFLKLRYQRPKNPLMAGIAIESDDGKVKTMSLTMPIIASIISRTFEHHVQNDTAEYVSVQLVQINELRPLSPKDTNQTYFMLVFRQNPNVDDAIDPSLVLDQLREIVWSDWLHFSAAEISQNRTDRTLTSRPLKYKDPEDRAILPRPFPSPWTPYLDLYVPACNSLSEKTLGILTGLPVTTPPFHTNQRLLLHILDILSQLFNPYLPEVLKDPTTFPNIIGLRTGKFTSNLPNIGTKVHKVIYVSASSQQIFNLFYQAQQKYVEQSTKPCINLFGFEARLIAMPGHSREDNKVRAKVHSISDTLYNNLQHTKQIPIPIENFIPTEITNQIIQRILQTKLVVACVPDFEDQTNNKITHYVVYVFRTLCTSELTDYTKLEETLPDFPKDLIKIPTPPEPTYTEITSRKTKHETTPLRGNHKSDLEAFDYMLQSPVFLNMTRDTQEATSNSVSDNSSIPPQEISTSKRPHLPTGETIKPPKQKPRGHTGEIAEQNPSDIPNNQNADHMDTETDSINSEEVPDSQYEFCPEHSQSTRLEVIDALGIARSISEKRYRETHHFIVSHGNTEFDLDLLKRIASRPATPPPNTRAHNESKAHPTHNK